ncbi:MAG: helix-turn-helix domain-containing protein [Acetobacteraceae bacterium]|nr:helix-turn-helix domain-containing protein [Acetobacteraceae bacterium]
MNEIAPPRLAPVPGSPLSGASARPELRGRPGQRANAADRHVGARIRERRVMLGLSQQQLAQMIGVTYQQAHKYERGLNRISAGRLYEIAQVMGVPVSWFFEGLAGGGAHDMNPQQRLSLELARNFALIENDQHRQALSAMARALASAPQG